MLFSIIMCTYNSGKTLRYAVESVRRQSCGDWELVILDNGSGDDTVGILKEYQEADSRIRCEFKTKNVGWCRGISLCLPKAMGEYMMFLGADDFLADGEVLADVQREIARERPDIVWTGCRYVVWENGEYKVGAERNKPYRVYKNEDKLTQLAELMDEDLHYNSVMHYVRIDFLREHGIDFWKPFYGDCQGMTEALCRAEKMVVLGRVAYMLTVNTSQTAGKVGFDYDMSRQWRSIRKVLPNLQEYPKARIEQIAERIFRNLSAMLAEIAEGVELRDAWQNPMEVSLPERFRKVESWLSTDAFGEMMLYAGREAFAEHLIGAAGVLYWSCSRYPRLIEEIKMESHWLAGFVDCLLVLHESGEIGWRKNICGGQADRLIEAWMSDANPWRIGGELILRDGVLPEESKRERVKTALRLGGQR